MKPGHISTICIIAAFWCLVLMLVPFGNYSVYQVSKWLICLAAVYAAIAVDSWWRFVLILVAICFNPIAPIYFGRDVWKVIDGIAAGIFFITGFRKNNSEDSAS